MIDKIKYCQEELDRKKANWTEIAYIQTSLSLRHKPTNARKFKVSCHNTFIYIPLWLSNIHVTGPL